MKNWMLVCCYERDIETPKFFDTKEEAVKAMCADVADYIGFTVDEVIEARSNSGEIDNCTYIGIDYAWSDRHANCDWKIFNLIERV